LIWIMVPLRGGSAARPSWLCPNGKCNKRDHSHAENYDCDGDHFDVGKASYHAPSLAAVERRH
jgi:hypothetical protein